MKDFSLDDKDYNELKKQADVVRSGIENNLKKNKIKADVFYGGSFAKKTLLKKNSYDVDIYVRFHKVEDTGKLGKVVRGKRVHGSRDYYQIEKGNVIFEIIPVLKISHPSKMENVTDLSYFHVNYVKRNLNDKLRKEVVLAKAFCHAQKIYGAESYVKGFSGYALECLVIHFGSFRKFLSSLAKVKDKLVIDPKKQFKNKNDVLRELNEGKTHSPIVFVDPTWKERNVTAALSLETFKKLQDAAKKYIKRPGDNWFVQKSFGIPERKGFESVIIELKTSKQEGDIAGAKLLKGFNFIAREFAKKFDLKEKDFDYAGTGNKGVGYLIVKPKNYLERAGPSLKMEKACKAFKKANKQVVVKKGRLYAKLKSEKSGKEFLKNFILKNRDVLKSMDVSRA